MKLTKRGSFGTKSRALRVNHGKFFRPTSVTVGGVNVRAPRSRSSSGRSSGPTKAERVAQFWKLKPGIHYMRIHVANSEPWDIVVKGEEVTFARVEAIKEAFGHKDSARMLRAFRAFVQEWNLVNIEGKPIPITVKGIEGLGLDAVFGITNEIVFALGIPTTPWIRSIYNPFTDQPVRLEVADQPFSEIGETNGEYDVPPVKRSVPTAKDDVQSSVVKVKRANKSMGTAYLLWLVFGLIGGHRYYLGRPGTAFLMTITLGGLGVWWIIDLFLIPSIVRLN